MPNRAAVAAALVAAIALLASGCNSTTTGAPTTGGRGDTTPVTSGGSTSTSASASDPLANVDPCTLLDPAVVTKSQLDQGKSGTQVGARFCRWNKSSDSTGPGYSIAINIYDHAGLGQLNTTDFTVAPYPLSSHTGKLSKGTAGNTCAVSMGITSTSRVDIVGVDGAGNVDAACEVAMAVASSVELRLPAGS